MRILLAALCFCFLASDAAAQENTKNVQSSFPAIRDFIADHGDRHRPLNIEEADLNGDNFPEYIVSQPELTGECPPETGCDYYVLGQAGNGLIEIARFKAFRVRTEAVQGRLYKELLVHNDPLNDFGFTRFVWVPEKARYLPYEINSQISD